MQQQSSGALELLKQLGITSNATKTQAHGMTVAQIEDLRLQQASGENLKKIKANVDSNYEILEHEAGLVHVLLEIEEWKKGTKLSKGVVKKFHENDFRAMSKTVASKKGERPRNAFSEYDVVKIVHDPSKNKGLSAVVNPESKEFTDKIEDMNIDQLRAKYFDLSGQVNETDDEIKLRELITEAIEASK